MLRNIRDWKPVAFILTIATIQMGLFFLVDNLFLVAVAVIAMIPFQVSASALNHNHHHCPTFRWGWMNRIYECMMFLQTGTTPFTWTLHHNIGHHENFLDQTKDTSPWKKRNGKAMSRTGYCLRNTLMMYPQAWMVGRDHPKLFFQFLIFVGVSSLLLGAFILGSPLKAVLVFVVPMTLMLFILVDATYGHHAGLDTDDPYEATHNILDRHYNRFSWNLGYHTAHHLRPGLHWTHLPDAHKKILAKIPTNLLNDEWDLKKSLKRLVGK